MQLQLKNIRKQYQGIEILKEITVSFDSGKCYLLLGKNGAGKSTLAKCIAGDEYIDAGEIKIDTDVQNIHTLVSIQYQYFESYKYLKIREIIALFQKITQQAQFSKELFELLGLNECGHILLKNASGGQKKSLTLFLAVLLNRPILVLDEPFADLDLLKKRRFMHFLEKYIRENEKILIIISHEVAEFQRLFDYTLILHEGKIAEIGSTIALQEKYNHEAFPGIEGVYYAVTGQILGGEIS